MTGTTYAAAVLLAMSAGARCDTLPPPLTFHASLDGSLDASAQGSGEAVSVEGPVAYRPGKVGQALLCGEGGALLHYASEGNLRRSCGACMRCLPNAGPSRC